MFSVHHHRLSLVPCFFSIVTFNRHSYHPLPRPKSSLSFQHTVVVTRENLRDRRTRTLIPRRTSHTVAAAQAQGASMGTLMPPPSFPQIVFLVHFQNQPGDNLRVRVNGTISTSWSKVFKVIVDRHTAERLKASFRRTSFEHWTALGA